MESITLPLLSITTFLPLLGTLVILLVKPDKPRTTYRIGIGASTLAVVTSLGIWLRGVGSSFNQIEQLEWIPSLGIAYRMGIDGISFPLVLLTTVLFLTALIYSAKIEKRANSYVMLFLLLETACLGVFMALDLFLFYVFFEVTLVGMYFIIAEWGHENSKQAALTFFLYTLLGSLFLLLAFLSLYLHSDPLTFDMRALIANPPLTGLAAALTFWGLFVAFAIKTPLVPVHTWLPAAHTEAPAAGSAILAGVLLKLGAYGFIRFSLQMTPDAFQQFAPYVIVISVITALYGALVALAQTDIKRMVAYTSVNHMGYMVFGVAAAAALGKGAETSALDGATLQMISHGVVTGLLFLLVGALQDRTQTREMTEISGLLKTYPVLSGLFIVAAFASLGLPGLAHFPAEFQIFLGGFSAYPVATGFIILGLLITTGLYLRAIQSVFMGNPEKEIDSKGDLDARELWATVPLIAAIFIIGIYPDLLLSIIHATTELIGF
ncbi:complex I subunit 4 family protein [Fodinibius salsisoli]|uniref:NADH-quinone oxidoreductase subunit M n=1 Tax=Fodinibius salsisoli TaxID=2820877 RepID=A0ABT3PJV7_9BACT|nr:NADH-quinone oxidoreductase subunit M [Fodinibius salsisoli]MCW9706233.1 NADH-quinone oxidoreductase subunit M [Fodinibius salsisoli]